MAPEFDRRLLALVAKAVLFYLCASGIWPARLLALSSLVARRHLIIRPWVAHPSIRSS
jgi:hypothetical protein